MRRYACVTSYRVLRAGDAGEEDKVRDEEADAEVEVDGVAGALDGAEQGEGENAEGQAHQRQGQAHPGDHPQLELVLVRGKMDEQVEKTDGPVVMLTQGVHFISKTRPSRCLMKPNAREVIQGHAMATKEGSKRVCYLLGWYVSCRYNPHLYFMESHEHSKAAEVTTGTHCVILLGLQHSATSVRPRSTVQLGLPIRTATGPFIGLGDKRTAL